MTTIGLLVERFRVLIRGALKANALPVAAAMEMEEDWLSLWEEENGLCAVNQQQSDFISWDSDLMIDVEVRDILKLMNNTVFMIKYASLNHLVTLLTHCSYYDPNFLKIFFWTFHSFTTPEVLFKKLWFRYTIPSNEDVLGKTVKNRAINAFKFWIKERFNEDFDSTSLQPLMESFLECLSQDKHPAYNPVKTLYQKAVDDQKLDLSSTTPLLETLQTDILKFSAVELAENLCLAEFEFWKKVKPADLLTKKNEKTSPNVTKLVAHFNAIQQWVSSRIVKEERLSKRSKILLRFIEVALELEKLNNFSGLFAVVCGINNSSVLRLKWTFAEISEKVMMDWKAVADVMQPTQNYGAYRNHVRSRNPPLIPYLGQYLTDLTMVKDGNPDLSPEGLINFHKRQLLYKIISEIELSQATAYEFKRNAQVADFFKNLESVEDEAFNNELFALSKVREPRSATTKKALVQ